MSLYKAITCTDTKISTQLLTRLTVKKVTGRFLPINEMIAAILEKMLHFLCLLLVGF